MSRYWSPLGPSAFLDVGRESEQQRLSKDLAADKDRLLFLSAGHFSTSLLLLHFGANITCPHMAAVHVGVCVCAYIHARMHACVCVHTYIIKCMYVCVYIYKYVHKYIHNSYHEGFALAWIFGFFCLYILTNGSGSFS